MSHVLVCGAAGYTNLGDDAILWGMLTDLQAAMPGRALRVAGGPGLGSLLAPFEAVPVSYDERAEVARAIEDADLVIVGGGGVLYDFGYDASLARVLTDPPDRQWLYELAKIAAAARAAGRPVMMYGVGVGPLFTEAARQVARFIGEQSAAITLRDQASADLLVECGIPPSRIWVTADPAVAVDPGPPEVAETWLEASGIGVRPRPWVALNFRAWHRFWRAEPEQADGLDRLIAAAGGAVRELCDKLGGTAVMLPLQHQYDNDQEMLDCVLAAAGRPANALLVDPPPRPPDLVSALARFDLMVGMRLHSLLLAMNAGLPFVGLAYERKVEEFAQAAGLGDHLQRIEAISPEALVSSCQALLARRAEVSASLATRRIRLRQAAALSARLACDLLETALVTLPPPALRATAARPAKGLRVLMQTRPDYQTMPGGDVLQLTEIMPRLREAGVQVDLTGELTPDLSGYDLVHTINLDRPEEPYQHCLNALRQGKPVVMSPVHTDMTEFLEWGDPDYWEMPDPAEGDPAPRRAPLQDPIELRRRARLHLLRQAVINWATGYLPNAQLDAEYLHRAFGMDLSRTMVVPHGIAEIFLEARPEPFVAEHDLRDFVLCAGRIEKRKNQLGLVAALRGTGIPLVIVGQPNPEAYRELCRRYADANVVFLDGMPQEKLASAYAAAKVHALVSWFEIPGLASLEAGAAGCNVVATDRGSPREYLREMAWYCDPRSVASIREAVLAAYHAPRSDRLREHLRAHCHWRAAAERTLEGYQLALGVHEAKNARDLRLELVEATRQHADWLARLAADRGYEAQRGWEAAQLAAARNQELSDWAHDLDKARVGLTDELERARAELEQVTSRRLYRWSAAAARAGYRLARALRIKQ